MEHVTLKKHWTGFLSMFTFLIPFLLLAGLGILYFTGKEIPDAALYGSAGVGILSAVVHKLLYKTYLKYKEMDEYDEFGQSRKKGRYDLTKEERRAMDLQKMEDMNRILSPTTMKKVTKQGSRNPADDMNHLIGLYPVKKKMKEMVARMKFERQTKDTSGARSLSGRHMVFFGAPGTGKTTVARILTGFLYKYKYIEKNQCVEVDGNFLKAGTPSDTATKVKLLIRHAYGGVLFIDEAYALNDNGDGCGKEAIATLIKEMEDHRNDFILILAGYTGEMKELLDANPGFHSRIKEYLDFPDYSIEEMKEIFRTMAAENNFVVSGDAYERLEIRFDKEKRLPSFGNARTVRNVLDEVIDKHSLNYIEKKLKPCDKYKIRGIDVPTSVNAKRI